MLYVQIIRYTKILAKLNFNSNPFFHKINLVIRIKSSKTFAFNDALLFVFISNTSNLSCCRNITRYEIRSSN